jgi:chemotaxis response regulator CheB
VNATVQREGPSRHHPNIAFDVMALAASPGGPKSLNCILAGLPMDDFAFALRTLARAQGG